MVDEISSPLAPVETVYSDMRPGYDITANVMMMEVEKGSQIKFKLYDFESLCLTEIRENNDKRFSPSV